MHNNKTFIWLWGRIEPPKPVVSRARNPEKGIKPIGTYLRS